ncbi:Nodulation protein N [Sulfitobacter sp. D7]|nr:MaoC family dehydratase [Sulfitobacter sp. D7]AYE87818.1 Nodulation protein N [Sulfitobacter sp. D7]
MRNEIDRAEMEAAVGCELGVSPWFMMDQARIDAFADVTEDHQFIHVDPVRAAETDFGGTVAHGMLTLSMMSGMAYGALPVMTGAKASINYGFDSVRFVAAVHSGKRIRGRFTLAEAQTRGRGNLMTRFAATVEIEGAERPAVKADWLVLYMF